jgi:dTDP-4-amino-4,6-dideoxygalactose transaminase
MVGRLGDIACFSFNGNKIITTGGGGMVVTDDQEWAERARYLTTQAKDDPVEYVHNEIGYNYRLTNVLAAMGVAQMERLDEFIAKKRALASVYTEAFRELEDLTLMVPQPDTDPTYWLYTVLLHGGTTPADRKRVISGLNEAGIGARPLWHTLHDLPPYRECPNFEIEHAVRLYERGISLPSSVGLAPDQQQRCIDVVGTLAISSG